MSGFRKIYDLHDDEVVARRRGPNGSTFGRLLRRLHRSASRATGPMSLVLEHGEIGSDAWWNAIADGRISVHTVTGQISRIFNTGLPAPDWPEFEIESGGERSSWTRQVSGGEPGGRERREKSDMYEVGRFVRLRYVRVPLKPPLSDKKFVSTVIDIWISEDKDQSQRDRPSPRS